MDAYNEAGDRCESTVSDEAEGLIWALLDDQIKDDDIARLEQLLMENQAVRERYVECVNLHVDLTEQLSKQADSRAGRRIASHVIAENLPTGLDGMTQSTE